MKITTHASQTSNFQSLILFSIYLCIFKVGMSYEITSISMRNEDCDMKTRLKKHFRKREEARTIQYILGTTDRFQPKSLPYRQAFWPIFIFLLYTYHKKLPHGYMGNCVKSCLHF